MSEQTSTHRTAEDVRATTPSASSVPTTGAELGDATLAQANGGIWFNPFEKLQCNHCCKPAGNGQSEGDTCWSCGGKIITVIDPYGTPFV